MYVGCSIPNEQRMREFDSVSTAMCKGGLARFRRRFGVLIGPALVVLASCGTGETVRREAQEGKDAPLPAVNCTMGNVRFDPLLDALVAQRASGRTVEAYAALKEAKAIFENRGATMAMAGTAEALAQACALGNSPVERLVLAEALHQMTRCCFYHRPSFEPASTLLDSAMAISRQLAFSSDTTLQQIALFQLARHHDVMQGLTNRFGNYVQHLSPKDWTYASCTALYIKRVLLGLKGAPVVRSLSNLALDHSALCNAGYPEHCRAKDQLARSELGELQWLTPDEGNTYGEFIQALTIMAWDGLAKEARLDSLAYLLEVNLRVFTGQPDIKLGDPFKQFTWGQGSTHWMHTVAQYFHDYIHLAHAEELLPSYQLLVDSIRVWDAGSYMDGRFTGTIGMERLGRAASMQHLSTVRDLPLSGSAGYSALADLIRPLVIQERQWMTDKLLVDSFPRFRELRRQQLVLEEKLLDLESTIAGRLQPLDLLEWSALLAEDQHACATLNAFRLKPVSDQQLLPLRDVQAKLRPNEVWLVVLDQWDWVVVGVCSRFGLLVDSVPLHVPFGSVGRTARSTMNHLADRTIQGGAWSLGNEKELRDLSQHLFDRYLPPSTEHVVLTYLGQIRTPLIETLVTLCRSDPDGSGKLLLRSIRTDNAFALDPKADQLQPYRVPDFLGVAPGFLAPSKDLLATVDMDDLLARMNATDQGMTRDLFGPLEHNVSEVLGANRIMQGVVLTDTAADEAAALRALSKGGVIHLATHAMVQMRAIDRSGVVLSGDFAPNGTGVGDNVWRIPEIRSMQLDAELVVLSACQTNVGPTSALGLESSIASAFREAGCRNIISSMWKVDDRATHDIILAFYRHLAEGKGKAEALFAAKADYRRQHPDKGPHFWAPLVLHGDDRPVMPAKRR